MTIKKFESILKSINPKLRVRVRSYGDIAGIFVGKSGKSGYIARMTKGELQLNGYRYQLTDPTNPLRMVNGIIKKRGRKTLVNLLRNWRWLKNHRHVSKLMWGLQ